MIRSSISSVLLVTGLLWTAVVLWFCFAVGGIGYLTPSYLPKALLWFSWLFVGPLLLITGAILALIGTHQRVGAILSLVGCVILTGTVGFLTLSVLHDAADPLIVKPPCGEVAVAIILTLLADAAAVQLYRLASLSGAR